MIENKMFVGLLFLFVVFFGPTLMKKIKEMFKQEEEY